MSGVAPVNTVAPAITGTLAVGEDLTCSSGTWTGDATITYAYQWYRAGHLLAGETTDTRTQDANDVGFTLRCKVTATNGAGSVSATVSAAGETGGSDDYAYIEKDEVVATFSTLDDALAYVAIVTEFHRRPAADSALLRHAVLLVKGTSISLAPFDPSLPYETLNANLADAAATADGA